jgi:hypothetical protein
VLPSANIPNIEICPRKNRRALRAASRVEPEPERTSLPGWPRGDHAGRQGKRAEGVLARTTPAHGWARVEQGQEGSGPRHARHSPTFCPPQSSSRERATYLPPSYTIHRSLCIAWVQGFVSPWTGRAEKELCPKLRRGRAAAFKGALTGGMVCGLPFCHLSPALACGVCTGRGPWLTSALRVRWSTATPGWRLGQGQARPRLGLPGRQRG